MKTTSAVSPLGREEPSRIEGAVKPGKKGRCPHCGAVVVFDADQEWHLALRQRTSEAFEPEMGTDLHAVTCPACDNFIIDVVEWESPEASAGKYYTSIKRVYPVAFVAAGDGDVPSDLWQLYDEARSISKFSSRGAALLARRCLQQTLESVGFRAKNLDQEIELASKDSRVTSQLKQMFHIVRMVGNYAAHPTSDSLNSTLDVEVGELDACLGAIGEAFDVFFIKPAQHQRLLAGLNAKLSAASKPQIT